MSWEATLLTTWSSAGGRPVADLGSVFDVSSIRLDLSGRGETVLELDAASAYKLLSGGDVVRVTRRDRGDFFERRVVSRSRPTLGENGTRFEVVALPRLYDLDGADLVRETQGGRSIFRFDQLLKLRAFLERFIFTNLDQDGLTGLVLGSVPETFAVRVAWDRWSRGQLLNELLNKFRMEVRHRYREDGAEELSFAPFVNDSAPIVPLRYGDRLASHEIREDYQQLCTVARIVGEPPVADAERATIGENAWTVAARTTLTGGRMACELREIGGTRSPILEDGQWAGRTDVLRPDRSLPVRYLQRADRVARTPILGSSAADSTVIVAAAAAPAVGERVSIVADAAGNPLELLELPQSIERFGYVVRDVQVPGGRGEQQYASNGGHEAGLTGWTPVNGGDVVELLRTEFDVDFTVLANGSRLAGEPTTTPLAIDNAPRRLVRGDILQQQGAQLPPTAAVIPSTAGVLAFNIAGPGLPAGFSDNDRITFVRRELATLTLAVATPRASGFLILSHADAALVQRLVYLASAADVNLTGPAGETFGGAVAYPYPGNPNRIVYRYGGYGSPVGAPAPVLTGDRFCYTYSVLSAQRIRFIVSGGSGTIGSTVVCTFVGSYFAANVPEFCTAGGGFLRFVGTVVGTGVDGSGNAYVDADWLGVPADASLIGLTASIQAVASSTPPFPLVPNFYSYSDSWSGDFPVRWQRETRELRFDGAHPLGTTALTFKPIAQLARRNWQSGDTLYHLRAPQPLRLRFTAINLSAGTLTADLTNSNVQDFEDLWSIAAFQIQGTFERAGDFYDTLTIQLLSRSGSTITWAALESFEAAGSSAGTPQLVTTTVPSIVDSYMVTGAGAWAATGLATVLISVPAGRTLFAGDRLWANWHGDSGASMMIVATTVTGPASSVEVRGGDAYPNTYAGMGDPLTALYRVTTDSYLELLGNTLRVAAATALSGGAQNVTLMEPNTNAIPNDAVLRCVRPRLFGASDRLTGSAMRLFCPVGGTTGEPLSGSPGAANTLAYFRVPAGSSRTITARVVFRLSIADWLPPHAGSIAIVSEAGAILGWSAVGEDGVGIDAVEGTLTLVAAAVITASGRYGVRLFGGRTDDWTQWCVHDETMFYLGEATDAPYDPGSYASQMLLTAAPYVLDKCAPRISDTLTVQELSAVYAQALGIGEGIVPDLVEGGRVHLEDWDRLARVLSITSRPGQPIAAIEIGQLSKTGDRMLGEAVLAAGVGGVR